jgi:hypothetical protein
MALRSRTVGPGRLAVVCDALNTQRTALIVDVLAVRGGQPLPVPRHSSVQSCRCNRAWSTVNAERKFERSVHFTNVTVPLLTTTWWTAK